MSRPGPTRAAVAAAAWAVVLAAAACVNFVEPEPRPAHLSVSVQLADENPARAELFGTFHAGSEDGTRARSVAEPTVRILGRTVSPTGGGQAPRREYRETWDVAAAELDRATVELEGPRFRNDRPRAVLAVPLVWRTGPDSIAWPEGEDLALPLRDPPGGNEPPELAGFRWNLRVLHRDGAEFVSLYSSQGRDALPDPLEVPSAVLAAGPGDGPLEVQLDVVADARAPAGEAGYEASLQLRGRVVWHVSRP